MRVVLWAMVPLILLSACAPLQAYRTAHAGVPYDSRGPCEPSKDGALIPAADKKTAPDGADREADCSFRIREDASAYRLYFTEFDDQGWSFVTPQGNGARAHEQLAILESELSAAIDQPAPLSVVVFVPGWKHTAQSDDGNVMDFRLLLRALQRVEESGCGRRIVGVYVGWRGAGTVIPPLEGVTFWSRKNAASRVGQGDVRLLFAKLRNLQERANEPYAKRIREAVEKRSSAPLEAFSSDALDPCGKRMRLTIAGHSMGGLIVHTALAQSLVKDIVDRRAFEIRFPSPSRGDRIPAPREGDMVILINPAVEAARFAPLYRAATEQRFPEYRSPILISLTSNADKAVGMAFPIGRFFSTLFHSYPDGNHDDQSNADMVGLGMDKNRISHWLAPAENVDASRLAVCEGWVGDASSDEAMRNNVEISRANAAGLVERLRKAKWDGDQAQIFPLVFCSKQPLTLKLNRDAREVSANTPVWNVQTVSAVMAGHSDLGNPVLREVLRQLYVEGDERVLQIAPPLRPLE